MPSASTPGPSDRTGRFLGGIGADPELAQAAADVHVELVADRLDPATEIALTLTATLLLRMDSFAPTIHLVVPDDRTTALPLLPDSSLASALIEAYQGFSSAERLRVGPAEQCHLRLVFAGNRSGLVVNTNGWTVAVDTPLSGEGNALAAAYAGVLAAAEALKILLPALGGAGVRMQPWRGIMNLHDYGLSNHVGAPLERVDLGRQAWVGAGGVGSAAGWALAALHATGTPLTGSGIVVDHDHIDHNGTNLNRHLTALMPHRGLPKADLLVEILNRTGLEFEAKQELWGHLNERDRHPEIAIVSVDDDAARRQVQLDMPALILNAGTGDTGEYRITQHNLLDRACLACISHADQSVSGPDHALAQRLGIPLTDLQPYLHSRDPLPTSLASKLNVSEEEREQVSATPARDLAQHFCASLQLDEGPAVSIPMLSAAAGVLLAVELVKYSLPDVPHAPGQIIRTNILSGPHSRWRSDRSKTANCECSDPLYRDYYRNRWPGAQPSAPH